MQDVPCRVSYSIGWSSVVPALSARKVREQNGTCRMPRMRPWQDECGAQRDSMCGLPDGYYQTFPARRRACLVCLESSGQNGTCRVPRVRPGKMSAEPNATACVDCQMGYYQNLPCQASCLPCLAMSLAMKRGCILAPMPQRQDERRPTRNNMFGLQHRPLLQHERQRHVHKVSDRQVCERQCLQNMPHLSRRMDPGRRGSVWLH